MEEVIHEFEFFGDFNDLVTYKLNYGLDTGANKLEELENGKYIKHVKTRLKIPQVISDFYGISIINAIENYTISRNILRCEINTPEQLKTFFEFEENYTATNNCGLIKIIFKAKYLNKCNSMITAIMDPIQCYINQRLHRINREIENCSQEDIIQ